MISQSIYPCTIKIGQAQKNEKRIKNKKKNVLYTVYKYIFCFVFVVKID